MRREDLEALTKQELLELARKLDIGGRSALSKDGLIKAVLKAQSRERKPAFDKAGSAGARFWAPTPRRILFSLPSWSPRINTASGCPSAT